MTVNGETSGVKSGDLSCMFLVYINNINKGVTSSVWLFADDCIIYKLIKTPQDAEKLQDNLQNIIEWIKTW